MGSIILVRHGFSCKNAEMRHGGNGSSLTDLGKSQAFALSHRLSLKFARIGTVYFVKRTQCIETAQIIFTALRAGSMQPLIFEPFNLGVLAGLTESECMERYPALAVEMSRYRRGEIEISEIDIPGASDPVEFSVSAEKTLRMLSEESTLENLILVGTRSVLVGLLNAAHGRSPKRGGGYREIPWENCGYCVLSGDLDVEERHGVSI